MTASELMDVSNFRRDGFQVFESVVPPEVIQEVGSFLANKISETMAPAKAEVGCRTDGEFVKVIGEIAAGARGGVGSLSKSTRDALSGHFSLETRLSPVLWTVPYSERFQAMLKALLGSDTIFMHMPPTARYVLPGNIHAGVPPHQDISYNKHMTDFVTIWVPFVDIDDECGGVTMYRGSGHVPEYKVEQLASDFWQKGVPTNGYEALHCKIRAGDVLALNKVIIHGSTANRSNRIRISTDFRFFGGRDRSTKHFLDLQQRKVIPPQ
jgi:ectoine hydroxylase-related dioxygenase (phytanoyl-CoA dioxygenase family)